MRIKEKGKGDGDKISTSDNCSHSKVAILFNSPIPPVVHCCSSSSTISAVTGNIRAGWWSGLADWIYCFPFGLTLMHKDIDFSQLYLADQLWQTDIAGEKDKQKNSMEVF